MTRRGILAASGAGGTLTVASAIAQNTAPANIPQAERDGKDATDPGPRNINAAATSSAM